MTIAEISKLLESPKYDFLWTNPHLGKKIIFMTLGGSHAYGTNIETSDVDIRGCAINSKAELLGMQTFEQVVEETTDTTVYSFNKLVQLLLNCNPNTIELLGGEPSQYFMLTSIGQLMLDNKKLFLSRRAADSFGGYATSQLRRLENAVARDRVPQHRREEHILQSMLSAKKSFETKYTLFNGEDYIRLFTDDARPAKPDLDREVFVDVHLSHYPAREFNSILNELSNVIGTYEKLSHRNKKKDFNHLNKHAMHLVRLYHMCFDILEKEEINTYRKDDHDFLMCIRNGAFMNEDGTYKPEFFDIITEYEARLAYDKENTSLPENPDMKKVEEFVMYVNRRSIELDES